jgi:hypothetical protein
LLFTVLLLLPFEIVRAEVVLNYFRPTSQSDGILIEWETISETNSSGFYILRSLNQNQDYTRINILFLSESEAGEGVFYSYVDDQVASGTIYYYKLEAIDMSGASDFFGPVSVGYKLSTGTPTLTGTISPGKTVTSVTKTPTPSNSTPTQPYQSHTPTRTGISIVLPTSTLTPSATITGTISTVPTETLTLEPLPTFELIFPAITSTRAVTATPTSQKVLNEETLASSPTPQPISSRHVFLLSIISLLWLTLAGFIVLWFWKLFQDSSEVDEENSG